MKDGVKVIGVGLLLWAFGGSKKRKESSPSSQPSRAETPPSTPRPEASKVPPKTSPKAQSQADPKAPPKVLPKKATPAEKAAAREAFKDKKAGRGKPAEKTPREKNAQDLAVEAFTRYQNAGEEVNYAAADALTLYLLAGGEDGPTVHYFQLSMNHTQPNGWYDKVTSSLVVQLLDAAVDAAVSQYQFSIRMGEAPDKAAAEALAVYQREATALGFPIPKERLVILQSQLQIPLTGVYDAATQEALVQRGVVPP